MHLPIEGIVEHNSFGSVIPTEVSLRQNSSKGMISVDVSDVRPVKEVSFWRRWEAIWMARSSGTLVKRETASKETKVSLKSMVCADMNLLKSAELRTLCSVLPTSTARILERCLESWYVGDDTKDTIVRSGVSGLWILGRAYKRGMRPAEQWRQL